MVATATKERSCRSGRSHSPTSTRHHAPRTSLLASVRGCGPDGAATSLDEELSAGTDPRASAELSERASQLRSEPVRARLANTLIDPLVAGGARGLLTIGARPRRAALKRNLDELVPLVERAAGVADQAGRHGGAADVDRTPVAQTLYRKGDLRYALRAARMALDEPAAGGRQLRRAA
jgi:hypothetical protein